MRTLSLATTGRLAFRIFGVIDPNKRTLIEAHQSRIRRPPTLVLATPLSGEVDFATLFQEFDEPAE